MAKKIVLITGGGSGIGQALAWHLADCGNTVLVTGRRLCALEKTKNKHEQNIEILRADVSKEKDREKIAARIAEHLAITAEPARLDSQAKYAVVARGEAEAYLRLPRDAEYKEKIWDHAGGLLIVTEAGGKVTDITGRDLEFNHGHLLGKSLGVIVTNGLVHDAVIEAIRELGIGKF